MASVSTSHVDSVKGKERERDRERRREKKRESQQGRRREEGRERERRRERERKEEKVGEREIPIDFSDLSFEFCSHTMLVTPLLSLL